MDLKSDASFLVGYVEGLMVGKDIPVRVVERMERILNCPYDLVTLKVGDISVSGPAAEVRHHTKENGNNVDTSPEYVKNNPILEQVMTAEMHQQVDAIDKPKRLREDSVEEVLKLCGDLIPLSDIATMYNCTPYLLKAFLKRAGVDIDTLPNHGMKTKNIQRLPMTEEEKERLRIQCANMRKKRIDKRTAAGLTTAISENDAVSEEEPTIVIKAMSKPPTMIEATELTINQKFLEDEEWPEVKRYIDRGYDRPAIARVMHTTEEELNRFIANQMKFEEEADTAFPSKPFSPVPIDRLTSVHNEIIGKRNGEPLTDGDWPDIKHRHIDLKHSNTSIAGDYDVKEWELDTHIRRQMHKEKLHAEGKVEIIEKPLGNG